MRKLFLIVALLALSAGHSFAKFDPSFTWTSLETPHFLIYYHQGGEETARKAGLIAEDIHSRLVPRIKWKPKQRTHIVKSSNKKAERRDKRPEGIFCVICHHIF